MHDTVLIIDNGIEQTIKYRDSDFGKFLNVGDYIILRNTRYKICSKIYDAWNSQWTLIVE